ncbi:MAG: 16S rRNA (cytosine(1402)-N(4))-methyltransferase RsmH [Candidatus Melainabacteria bacterium]|nr:16S rRNA (cytosine(1402)-N(4))-methyltransferase RsmH [Candidatus Melainabacteria bacterium]
MRAKRTGVRHGDGVDGGESLDDVDDSDDDDSVQTDNLSDYDNEDSSSDFHVETIDLSSGIESRPDNRPHIPVMLEETLGLLNLQPGKTYVDATAGAGGHLLRIASDTGSTSTVYGIDRDLSAIERLQGLVPDNVKLIHSNYSEIREKLNELGVHTIDGGIMADLGVSSMQLDEAHRGFSFMRNGPLDMRMDQSRGETAENLLNTIDERDLADIIFRYGEERFARRIARDIVQHRPIKTTGQLSAIVANTLRKSQKPKYKRDHGEASKHPATRTFQAIRIAVNQELQCLEKFLEDALSMLAPGGRLVVLTFHSLEDRLVKQFLRSAAMSCVCPPRQPLCTCNKKSQLLIITRKPLVAGAEEVLANVRSRSAKLRAGQKLD